MEVDPNIHWRTGTFSLVMYRVAFNPIEPFGNIRGGYPHNLGLKKLALRQRLRALFLETSGIKNTHEEPLDVEAVRYRRFTHGWGYKAAEDTEDWCVTKTMTINP